VVDGIKVGARLRRIQKDADEVYRPVIADLSPRFVYVSQMPDSLPAVPPMTEKQINLSKHAPNQRQFTADTWFVPYSPPFPLKPRIIRTPLDGMRRRSCCLTARRSRRPRRDR
jgi:hypothetical protein